jgi:hypothetical protein
MALFDTFSNPFEGMNIFGARIPTYLSGTSASEGVDATKGLLSQPEIDKLKNQALFQGLLGTAATYLAQPKNQNYGSALPYLAKSFLGGMQGSQGAYDQATQNLITKGKLQEAQREAETASTIKETQTNLMADERVKSNPVLKALVAKGQFDKVSEYLTPKSTFGTGVEGSSLGILAKGSKNTPEGEALRKTTDYALAYRNQTSEKIIPQETMDADGNVSTTYIKIKPSALPPNILPPIYDEQGVTTQAVDLTKPAITSKPGQTTPSTQPVSTSAQPSVVKKVGLTEPDKRLREGDLRKEYNALPDIKAYNEVNTAYNQIKVATQRPSPANDLAAATKFMKLLDPNSVVRESELIMAVQASGLSDRIANTGNRILKGEKLTATQRKDFFDAATQFYKIAVDKKSAIDTQYTNIGIESNLNYKNVIPGIKTFNPKTGKFE